MLREDYCEGRVLCVNLVSEQKKEEKALKLRYEELFNMAGSSSHFYRYVYFDFHAKCNGNSQPYIELVNTTIFPSNIEQSGIYRKTVRTVGELVNGEPNTRVST